MRKFIFKLFIVLVGSQLITTGFLNAQTGTWTAVKDTAPHLNYGVCLLLTDGTVICHNRHGGKYGTGWDHLTPDIHGSYVNGTWDTIASMHLDRLYFSSQVLPNGNVYVAGGEYGSGDTAGEVYNPLTNTWTMCGPPPTDWNIYDGNSEILYNGTVLEGPQIGAHPSYDCLFYNPGTNLFTLGPTAFYNHDEAPWLKLPDSSILFVGIATTYSNRYIPQLNKWIHDDTVPGKLYDYYGEEAGGAIMLPNGKAIFFGATPFNAIYTPSGDTIPGTWTPADSFPVINGVATGMADASSAMMVNGRILCAVSPLGTSVSDEFRKPTYFLEYDYTTNSFTQVTDTIPVFNADSLKGVSSSETQMLDLPDGTILLSFCQNSKSAHYFVYTPGSGPIPQGKPTIDNLTNINCNNYFVTGKLFNGISEGASFGDDWQMATNYPLVRLTNGTNVYYARTTNWNRIGALQTDSLEDTTYFTLPSIAGGTYSVVVVANGFASNPVMLTTFGVEIAGHTNTSPCNSGLGSATAFAAEGFTPYTYSWSPSGGTDSSASNLEGGIYTITVTGSDGCSTSASVTITEAGILGIIPAIKEVKCIGGSNGSITAVISGGTSPFTYLWNGGSTKATISGLSIGTYSVMVSDSCGYSATASATVTQPNVLGISIDTIIQLKCYGELNGKILTKVTGGTKPFTYLWSGGGGTKDSASGLSAGIYVITVTDSCGNTARASANITQPEAIVNTIISNNCTPGGGCDGSAIILTIGGTSPYTYNWVGLTQTTDTINNYCAGTYCCLVKDSHGCFQTTCVDITAIDEIGLESGQIKIYPNPNNGNFTLRWSDVSDLSVVEVYNVYGQKLFRRQISGNLIQRSQSGQVLINLSEQPNGIYFYRALKEDGNLISEGKLVIQK